MVITTLTATPCGSGRPNCRALAAPPAETKGLCQIHSAWCPDDHHPQPTWVVRSVLEQRTFRTGG
jgi:hypothetical protein